MSYSLVPPLLADVPLSVKLKVTKNQLILSFYGETITQEFIYNRRIYDRLELSYFSNCSYGFFVLERIQKENDIEYSDICIDTNRDTLIETLETRELVINAGGREAKKEGLHVIKSLDLLSYQNLTFF